MLEGSEQRPRWPEVAALAAVAAALTLLAWYLHPAWDDGWLWLQLLQGSASVAEAMGDRPMLGWIWSRLSHGGCLLPVSAVLHLATWLGLALLTGRLWRILFPRYGRAALVPSLLVLGTVTLRIQHVLVNPVWGALTGTVLVYLVAVAALRGSGRRPSGAWMASTVVAVPVAVLLSEYGLVTALVTAVLVASLAIGDDGRRRTRIVAAAVILGTALLAYLLFLATADPAIRPETSPGRLLEPDLRRVLAVPFLLLSQLWQSTLGSLLSAFAALRTTSAETLATFAGSAVATAFVARWVEPSGEEERAAGAAPPGNKIEGLQVGAVTLSAIAGLLVVLVTGRFAWTGATSRFLLPVAPLLAVLSFRLLLVLARPRFHRALALAVAGVVFFTSLTSAGTLLGEKRLMDGLAAVVAPRLDPDGYNLVVVVQPAGGEGLGREPSYALTARLAEHLEDPLRRRVQVVLYEARRRAGVSGIELFGGDAEPPEMRVPTRGLQGRIAFTRVVWVELCEDGRPVLRVEGPI